MFQQLLTPVGGSLWLSFLAAILPIATVFILLGVARRPAWQASLAGLVVGLVIAIVVWRFPIGLAFDAVLAGVVFAIWPVMWIVFNAIFLYNVSVTSGRFDAFRQWVLEFLPNDRRVVLVVIAFCFGALLEGIAGFGAPIAIASSLLILVGFSPIEALVFTLIFDTAPVAFGALGVPITVLGAVTHLKPVILGEMVGRQLPFVAAILPFYVIGVYGGLTAIAGVWPVLLVAGTSFGISQFVCSNYVNYALTDVLSSLGSLIVTLLFLRVWRPRPDAKYALGAALSPEPLAKGAKPVAPWGGWLPWLVVSAIVIVWTFLGIAKLGAQKIPWPGLDKAVSITLYKGAPYAAIWNFEPLATGTAILVAVLLTAALVGVRPAQLAACAALTWKQTRIAILTVALIIGLAYLMNYSGLNYTLGLAVSSLGLLFVFLSPFLGWIAVFLSGSDTSGNALFGNLQVVAANQLGLDPVLFAASNSSGGVMGKMISPQNISTGVSVTGLRGREGDVFRKTFPHSIVFTVIIGILVALEQFVFHGVVPH